MFGKIFFVILMVVFLMGFLVFVVGIFFLENVEVFIIWLFDGVVIQGGKFWVCMGLCNMGIFFKGVEFFYVGYYYLLIDMDLLFLDEFIFFDWNYFYFGVGNIEVWIEFLFGKYILQLLLGDYNYVFYDLFVYLKKIMIMV